MTQISKILLILFLASCASFKQSSVPVVDGIAYSPYFTVDKSRDPASGPGNGVRHGLKNIIKSAVKATGKSNIEDQVLRRVDDIFGIKASSIDELINKNEVVADDILNRIMFKPKSFIAGIDFDQAMRSAAEQNNFLKNKLKQFDEHRSYANVAEHGKITLGPASKAGDDPHLALITAILKKNNPDMTAAVTEMSRTFKRFARTNPSQTADVRAVFGANLALLESHNVMRAGSGLVGKAADKLAVVAKITDVMKSEMDQGKRVFEAYEEGFSVGVYKKSLADADVDEAKRIRTHASESDIGLTTVPCNKCFSKIR